MTSQFQHTLWLWLEGMFPRRISYYLLMKGLVASPSDLLHGKTGDPSLRLSLINFDTAKGFTYLDAEDPAPKGASTPCLRIIDPSTGDARFIHESSAILTYLETVYGGHGPALAPEDAVSVAIMNDLIAGINLAVTDGAYYIKHAVPQSTAWSLLKNEERSHAAALNAYAFAVKNLLKVQLWANPTLSGAGWLTPGIHRAGLVDATLAGGCRYLDLTYGWDMLENEELSELKEWYKRFKVLPWWSELEDREDVHPSEMRYGSSCREV
ncbi:hypothetical protein JX265_013736 [Neoarthrinium moseri]|uniref:GST N-terminal domain-containing protein n=1 Tax=Neoarthrinium moseri TaxID=1658444 RepID=A0A9P9W828_9PEZI|nr:hypothetical protein JX266_011374 [Neoarthrinium moseri]KAI1848993.1 hypothetical protein JX265_013736 [Neoarthrinium moseri]